MISFVKFEMMPCTTTAGTAVATIAIKEMNRKHNIPFNQKRSIIPFLLNKSIYTLYQMVIHTAEIVDKSIDEC